MKPLADATTCTPKSCRDGACRNGVCVACAANPRATCCSGLGLCYSPIGGFCG